MKTGLIVATSGLVASLVALVCLWQAHDRLASENLRLNRQNATLRGELKLAREQADRTARDAATLDTALGAAKSGLTGQKLREADLLAEIADLRERAAPETDPAQREDYQRRITDLEARLTALLARALATPPADAEPAPSPPAPVAIVRLSEDGEVAVLGGGTDHGLRPGHVLTIRRGTSELAQVQITDARTRLAVARVVPGSLKGKLQTGDPALLSP